MRLDDLALPFRVEQIGETFRRVLGLDELGVVLDRRQGEPVGRVRTRPGRAGRPGISRHRPARRRRASPAFFQSNSAVMSEHSTTSAAWMLLLRSCAMRCTMRSQPLRSTCTSMPGCAASNALAIFSAVCNSIEVYQTILPSFFALASRSGVAAVGAGAAAKAAPAAASSSDGPRKRRRYSDRFIRLLHLFVVACEISARQRAAMLRRKMQPHRSADRDIDLRAAR